MAVRYKLHPYY